MKGHLKIAAFVITFCAVEITLISWIGYPGMYMHDPYATHHDVPLHKFVKLELKAGWDLLHCL